MTGALCGLPADWLFSGQSGPPRQLLAWAELLVCWGVRQCPAGSDEVGVAVAATGQIAGPGRPWRLGVGPLHLRL